MLHGVVSCGKQCFECTKTLTAAAARPQNCASRQRERSDPCPQPRRSERRSPGRRIASRQTRACAVPSPPLPPPPDAPPDRGRHLSGIRLVNGCQQRRSGACSAESSPLAIRFRSVLPEGIARSPGRSRREDRRPEGTAKAGRAPAQPRSSQAAAPTTPQRSELLKL